MDRVLLLIWDDYTIIEKIIFILAAIAVAIIFIFLFWQLLYGREKNSSYISHRNTSTKRNANSFNSNYFASTKGSNNQKNANEKNYGGHGISSNTEYNHKEVITNEEEKPNPSKSGYEEYIKGELDKRIYRESINEDGTTKREIIFDVTTEEYQPVPFTPKYEYLTTANDGKFLKLLPTDEKSFFRTWVEDGVRKFEFHGNKDKALANFNAVFDDVCEIVEGKQNGATQIINDEPGTLDSNLKVETPAKIKLA